MGTARFRQAVLKGKSKVDRLFASGTYISAPHISARVLNTSNAESGPPAHNQIRFVLCVSRKAGKATRRNRIRRVLREVIDPVLVDLQGCYDLALFPGRRFAELDPAERERAFRGLLRKAKVLSDHT